MTRACGPNDNDEANTTVDEYHHSAYSIWESIHTDLFIILMLQKMAPIKRTQTISGHFITYEYNT